MAKKEAAPAASDNGTPKAKRGLDSELQCMAKIDRLLAELNGDAVHRVIMWLTQRNQEKMYARMPQPAPPGEAQDVFGGVVKTPQ